MKTKGRKAIVTNSAWSSYNFRLGSINAMQNESYEVVVITPINDFINHVYGRTVECYSLFKLTTKFKNQLNDISLYKTV